MMCVYSEFPNGVGKTSPLFSFKSFAGPMATPDGQFIFMKKPSSNLSKWTLSPY